MHGDVPRNTYYINNTFPKDEPLWMLLTVYIYIYYDTCNMNAKVNVKPWRTCSINTECTAMSPETHTIQTTHFHRMMHWDTRSTQYILTIRQCFPLSKTHEVYRLSIGGELSSTRVRPDSDTTVCRSRLKSCIKEWEFCIWPTWAPGVHSAMNIYIYI